MPDLAVDAEGERGGVVQVPQIGGLFGVIPMVGAVKAVYLELRRPPPTPAEPVRP